MSPFGQATIIRWRSFALQTSSSFSKAAFAEMVPCNFLRPWNENNVRLTELPENFELEIPEGAALDYLFLITTSRENFELRAFQRKNHFELGLDNSRIVFVVGEGLNREDPMIMKRIDDEKVLFQDIQEGNFIDVYENLTAKERGYLSSNNEIGKSQLRITDKTQ